MSSDGSITQWIERLRLGDEQAAQELWDRHADRLLAYARNKIRPGYARMADEEDAVLAAFQSFCSRAKQGEFPQLSDRDDLWRLLSTLTARKVANQIQYNLRQKRGGGLVRGESIFLRDEENDQGIADIGHDSLTPYVAACFTESLEAIMKSLHDPMHREIVQMRFAGYTNKEIAHQLGCSLSAVERKLRIIRRKLESHSEDI